MAIDPTAPVDPQQAPVPQPGFFDGQIPGLGPGDELPDDDEVQVAGPLGSASAAAARGISKLFGSTLSEARKKAGDPAFKAGRVDREMVPPPEVPPAAPPEVPLSTPRVPDPETQGPVLPELADDVKAAGVPPSVVPGAPARFKTEDSYDRYIRVGDDDVDAVLNAPENRAELLGGGLTDFNEGRIIDEAGIQERLEANSQRFAGKIDADKREVVTLQATQQLGDLLGMTPKKLMRAMMSRERGGIITVEGHGIAETMLAARNLLVSEMRKLDRLAEVARVGSDEQVMAFRYQLELVANLQRNLKGSQTEIARTLSAMRNPATGMPGDPTLAAEFAERSKRDLTAMLGEYGGVDSVRQMADLYSITGDPVKKGKFVQGASRLRQGGDALYEVWQHALLTNPITQIKNILGNILTLFISDVETAGAAAVGTARRALGGEGGVTFGDLNAKIFGQVMSLMTAIKAGGRSFATGKSALPGTKIDAAQSAGRQRVKAFSGEAVGATGTTGTVIDVLGHALTGGRVAFRALEFGDTFFKTVAYEGKMWEQALSGGRARGLRGEELSDFIADFMNDPPAYALSRAEAEAKYISLQTDLDDVGKAFKTLQGVPGFRWLVPFLKTPYNSFKWAFVDRSPLGLFWGDTRRMLDAGGRERDEAIARISTGSALAAVSMVMVYGGMITGGGPANPRARALDRRMGIQPYSIKVGNRYYSYAGTEPFASIIGIWADVAEITASGALDNDETTAMELFAAAIAGTAYNATNKSFMQGFATFIEATSDPARHSESMMKNLFRSLVPRLATNIERQVDPTVRQARDYIDELKAQIPGLSATLNPRVDSWGRDIVRGVAVEGGGRNLALGPDSISPIFISDYKPTTVDLELKRLKLYLPDSVDTFRPPVLREPIRMKDDERYWFQKQAGQRAFKQIKEFMGTSEYKHMKKMSEGGDVLVTEFLRNKIRGINRRAKKFALNMLMSSSPHSKLLLERIQLIWGLEQEELARQKAEGEAK
tara:strand:+ start:1807 stop:4809 length:3003 start_codon:yes stop_codon:yes gene_type:complete